MKRVFISRNLKSDSAFKQILESKGLEVYGESLISFHSINFNLSDRKPDWVFFYSKNGVRFFLEKVGLEFFKNLKIGTIGEGTAIFLKENKLQPDFIGNGEPNETAQQFSKVASRSRVLFPRAETSKKSVQTLLNDSIEILDLVVYKNIPKTDIELGNFDFLVFTSPMNAIVYFDHKKRLEEQEIVVIGKTTSDALNKLGISDFFVSNRPTESNLAAVVLDIFYGTF